MRRKIEACTALFLVSVLLFLSGCKLSVVSADKLIRPPRSGAEIESAIEELAGESITLKTPSNPDSEFTSPLTLIDLDSDGVEEAIAFYTTASNNSSIHLNVLKHISEQWVSIGDFSGYGNNIETLSFRNLSKDMNQYDIIATWSYIDSKVMTIHKVSGTGRRAKLKLVCNESYTSMSYVDVDADGLYELFLISGDFADKSKIPVAKVIRVDKYNILNIGMTSLSRDIVAFENSFCKDINNEKISMISVLDYQNSDKEYGTEVLYWDTERSCLDILRVDGETNAAFSTLRSLSILSNDVSGDAFVDIPVQEQIIGSSVNEKMYNSSLTYTKWCELVVEDDVIKLRQTGNHRLYFTDKDYFDVDPLWIPQITVTRNTSNETWTIETYNPENLDETKTLLVVASIPQENIDRFISSGYKQFSSYTADNKVFVYKITEDGLAFGISENNIVSVNL